MEGFFQDNLSIQVQYYFLWKWDRVLHQYFSCFWLLLIPSLRNFFTELSRLEWRTLFLAVSFDCSNAFWGLWQKSERITRITLNNLLFGKRFSSSSVRLKVRIRKFFCPVSTVIHFLNIYSNISVGLLFDFCCAGSLLQGEAFSSYAWA